MPIFFFLFTRVGPIGRGSTGRGIVRASAATARSTPSGRSGWSVLLRRSPSQACWAASTTDRTGEYSMTRRMSLRHHGDRRECPGGEYEQSIISTFPMPVAAAVEGSSAAAHAEREERVEPEVARRGLLRRFQAWRLRRPRSGQPG